MELVQLKTIKQLKNFIKMADDIYVDDKLYVPYMRKDFLNTLKKLVLEEKTYTALAIEKDGRYVARVLFTVAPSKQMKLERCGFFSHFECINDKNCASTLLEEMCRILKSRGITYVEGTYFPFDPDNRRGILASGYEYRPMILTSYNPPYYTDLLENAGFKKDFDTVSYYLDFKNFDRQRIAPLVKKILERYDLEVCHADFNNIEKEVDDIYSVIKAATNDIIFQDAPTREDLMRIAQNWKNFLWKDFIYICRKRGTGQPVGMMMSVPDFNEVFRKIKGRSNPIALFKALRGKKRIKAVRAILQYVIPEYQNKGVNYALYNELYNTCMSRGITYMEGGTVMENNTASRRNIENACGKLNKIFRIYGRQI